MLKYINQIKYNKFYVYILSILAAFLYASYVVLNRGFLIHNINATMFTFGSGLVAFLLSAGFLLNSYSHINFKNISRVQWKLIFAYCAASMFSRLFLFWGLAFASAANAGFLLAGMRPIFALLSGLLLMKEMIQGKSILIILGMIIGLFLLSTQGTLSFQAGDLLLMLCGALLGFLAAFSRQITTSGIHPLTLTFFTMGLGTIGILGIVAVTSAWSWVGWEAWILSGGIIFCSTLARNVALARMNAAVFSSLYLLSPVFSAIMGLVLLHEQVAPIQWLGGALILAGGYLLIRLGTHAPSR